MGDVGAPDAVADGGLVLVHLCSIDVSIPHLERCPDARDILLGVIVLPSPEPETGHIVLLTTGVAGLLNHTLRCRRS